MLRTKHLLFMSLLLLLGALPAVAQTQAEVPPPPSNGQEAALQVVRFSWAKYRPSILSMETGMPGAEATPDERLEDLRLQRQIVVERRRSQQNRNYPVGRLEERQWRRQQRLPEPGSTSSSSTAARRRPGEAYRYSIELENTGPKKVTAVEWDYVFVEASSGREMLRHSFLSKVGIGAGKRKKVTEESESPPYAVVDVKGLGGEQAGERVEIRRVVYGDGAVWEK